MRSLIRRSASLRDTVNEPEGSVSPAGQANCDRSMTTTFCGTLGRCSIFATNWDEYIRFLWMNSLRHRRYTKRPEGKLPCHCPKNNNPKKTSMTRKAELAVFQLMKRRPCHRRLDQPRSRFSRSLEERRSLVNSFYSDLATGMSSGERGIGWIALNRVGMVYFRPLVMAVLKNEPDETKRIHIFKCIERFIFIVFRMTTTRARLPEQRVL